MTDERPALKGTVLLEMSYDAEVNVQDCVDGWTNEEVAALLAGDPGAREELISAAAYHAFDGSEVEVDHATIEVNGQRL